MTLAFIPLHETLGAQVLGLDLHQPIDETTAQILRDAFSRYDLLLIRDTDISAAEQSRYGEVFGQVKVRDGIVTAVPSAEEGAQYISNSRADGILGDGELKFHQDHLFHDEPLRALMLCALEIPPSGSITKFRSGYAIYQALPPELRARAEAVTCLHAFDYERRDYDTELRFITLSSNAKTAKQPLVWRNPETGKPAVWVVGFSTAGFESMDRDEGFALVDEIWDIAEGVPDYAHQWQPGDLLLWNNLSLQHARMPFDEKERRTLRRTPLL
jgi:taurine dioxygenase